MKILSAGFLVADIVAANLPRVAPPSELVYAPTGIDLHTGGNPANLSIDLVKLGLTSGDLGVVGAVGDDIFGKFMESSLENYGIRTFLQKSEKRTSKDLILIVENEDRRFHVDPGANLDLRLDHVLKVIENHDPEIFYLASGITGIDSEVDEVLKRSKEKGFTTFLDMVNPYKREWDFLLPVLKYTDIFHCNVDEAINATGENDVEAAIRKLINKGAETVLISKGSKGVILATEDIKIEQPAFDIKCVDPSGAGDAFCSGILFKLINDPEREIASKEAKEITDILMYGQAAGAIACTEPGTTSAVSPDAVEEIIEKQKDGIEEKTTFSPFEG